VGRVISSLLVGGITVVPAHLRHRKIMWGLQGPRRGARAIESGISARVMFHVSRGSSHVGIIFSENQKKNTIFI
jgi:hypothetical protein